MKKLIFSIFNFFALSLLILPMPVSAQNYIQSFKNGKIDWSNGIIETIGVGAPPAKPKNSAQARAVAKRASVAMARRNLLEIINRIQINSRTLIKDFIDKSDIIRKEVSELSKNSHVVNIQYMSNGSVEATVAIELTGYFADLVLPKNIRHITPVKQAQAPNKKVEDVHTGLIVDCRGCRVKRAMAPRIVDEEVNVVYGSAYVSRNYAVEQGMAGYARDLKAAATNPRVGERPLILKGIRAAKTGLSDIVISNADAAKIRGTASNLSFLQQCRVIIVLD